MRRYFCGFGDEPSSPPSQRLNVLATPEQIQAYRMRVLHRGLFFELRGMRLTRKAPSCYSIIKREFGLRGDKQSVYEQFTELLRQRGILRE